MTEEQIAKWGSDSLCDFMERTQGSRFANEIFKFDFSAFRDILKILENSKSSRFNDTDAKIKTAEADLQEIEERGLVCKKRLLEDKLLRFQKAKVSIEDGVFAIFGRSKIHNIFSEIDIEIDALKRNIESISEQAGLDEKNAIEIKSKIEGLNMANKYRKVCYEITGNGVSVSKQLLKTARDCIRYFEEISDGSDIDCRNMKIEGKIIREMIKQIKRSH